MKAASGSALLYAALVTVPAPGAQPEDEVTRNKTWHAPSGRFTNPWPSWLEINRGRLIGERLLTGKVKFPDTTPPTVPVRQPTFLSDREDVHGTLRATWLGHACYFVEFPSGLHVLFDPVFEDRCSPLSFMGPKRFTKLPCEIKDIPTIDAVVISHSHYDHLSHPTVQEIAKRHPESHFFVPLGLKSWFQKSGIKKCTELDWWEEIDFSLSPTSKPGVSEASTSSKSSASSPSVDGVVRSRISCLPAQHTSNRSIHDRDVTLWASWSVSSGGKSVYFAGDTGYRSVPRSADGKDDWAEEYSSLPICPAFKQIGQLRGPFDLGLIPIGAYKPRYLFSNMHANPRDAVEIFRDTQCKKALGMHWGTWALTEEDVLEPPKHLKKALALHGLPEQGLFDICDVGESRAF